MKCTDETLRISLFFDCGTNESLDKTIKTQKTTKSAANLANHQILETNMYRLYCNLQNRRDPFSKAIYIGAKTSAQSKPRKLTDATTDFDQNNTNSNTQIAFNNLLDILNKFCLSHKNTNLQLKIDLFGFSRGAALARNFANLLNSDQDINDKINSVLRKNDSTLKDLSFGFIGLFDSTKTALCEQGKTKINLNLDKVKADAIFHLFGLHEFRKNYPLSSVRNKKHHATSEDLDTFGSSSNRITNTFEFAVPGSHSDIGGGHHLFEDENYIINAKPTYIAASLTESIHNIIDSNLLLAPLFSSIKFEYNIFRGGYTAINRRKNVYGHLQLIYARMILDTAAKFGVPFNVSQFEIAHTIPTELKYFYCKLIDSRNLLLNVKKFTSPNEVLDTKLIQKYVHLSASIRPSIDKLKKNSKISLLNKISEFGYAFSRFHSITAD